MFQQKLRLRTKDVRFLTRKGNRWYGKYFSFHSFPQYPNIPHNQISCHISIKYDKRAVHRNNLKKIILNYIQEYVLTTKKRNNTYYKIFIGLNKQNIENFKEYLKSLDETQQRMTVREMLDQHLREREKKLLLYRSRNYNDKKHNPKKHDHKKYNHKRK